MSAAIPLNLKCRVDDFSFQVYADSDERFWFRLERTREQDVITDYLLGALSNEQAGPVLAKCYQVLGLRPMAVIVFRDIVPGLSGIDTQEAKQAKSIYLESGTFLLKQFGATAISSTIEFSRGKLNLVLRGESPSSGIWVD